LDFAIGTSFAIESITVLPKPRRLGGCTGEPSRSVQLIVNTSPLDSQLTSTRSTSDRGCAVFAGIGGKFVECETDGLGGSRLQVQFRSVKVDPSSDQVRKAPKPNVHQILYIDSPPLMRGCYTATRLPAGARSHRSFRPACATEEAT
jgi:hypothetical protein